MAADPPIENASRAIWGLQVGTVQVSVRGIPRG